MVGDDKGRENLGDYGDFWGIFFDFFCFCGFFVGNFWEHSEHSEHSEQLGALGVWGRWWGLGLGGGWRQPASLSALSAPSAPSARMIRKCGVGALGFFFFGVSVFFVNLQKCMFFFEKEIFEIFLII